MRPGKIKIFILYSLVCFIWGSTWLGIKLGLEGVPPLVGAGVRFTLAGLLFLVPIARRKVPLRLNSQMIRVVAVLGGLNFGVSYGCVYWSEQYISSGLASILFCVYPFFVALLAHYGFGIEKLTWRTTMGIAIGFGGIVVIYAEQMQTTSSSLQGMLALLVATLASAISLVYLKRHGRVMNILVLNFYSMLWGAGLLFLGALVMEREKPIHWSVMNLSAQLYLAVFGSVIAFTIYFYLLRHLRATQMSFVSLIYPILALLLGAWFLHERVNSRLALGAVLVLAGIFMASRENAVTGGDESP